MFRMNRALLAAFLCAGGPVATGMCGMDQMSPFNEAQWTTLQSDTLVALTDRLEVEDQSVEISGPMCGLPSTSTAPEREPESGLR